MDRRQTQGVLLKQEIMLQFNERLYIQSVISKELYEQARIRIVSGS